MFKLHKKVISNKTTYSQAIKMSMSKQLHIATLNDHLEMVKYLVRVGLDVNERDCGLTPVHLALYMNNVPMIAYLISAGADVNARCTEEDILRIFTRQKGLLDAVMISRKRQRIE